ncbi:unnamed protein product [Scytosiphon promiscuus]
MEGKWTAACFTISYSRGTRRCGCCKEHLTKGSLRLGIIFKSGFVDNMLFQGFHLHCVPPTMDLSLLEGTEDLAAKDVEIVQRWISDGCSTVVTA